MSYIITLGDTIYIYMWTLLIIQSHFRKIIGVAMYFTRISKYINYLRKVKFIKTKTENLK